MVSARWRWVWSWMWRCGLVRPLPPPCPPCTSASTVHRVFWHAPPPTTTKNFRGKIQFTEGQILPRVLFGTHTFGSQIRPPPPPNTPSQAQASPFTKPDTQLNPCMHLPPLAAPVDSTWLHLHASPSSPPTAYPVFGAQMHPLQTTAAYDPRVDKWQDSNKDTLYQPDVEQCYRNFDPKRITFFGAAAASGTSVERMNVGAIGAGVYQVLLMSHPLSLTHPVRPLPCKDGPSGNALLPGPSKQRCRGKGMILPTSRDAKKNCPRPWGGGVVGGWLSVDMSQGTCPQLAVSVWTWIQWMSACPYSYGHLPVDIYSWTPTCGRDKGGMGGG